MGSSSAFERQNWKNNLSLPPRPPYKHRKEAHIPNSPCISSLVLPDAVVDTGLGHTGKDTQGSLGHMGGHSMQLGPRGGTRSTAWATWGDTQRSLGHMHEDTARPGPRRFLSQAFFLRFQVALAVHLARLSWCIVALSPCSVPPVLLPEEVMSFQPLLSAWWPAAPAQTWVQEPCGAGPREGHFSA